MTPLSDPCLICLKHLNCIKIVVKRCSLFHVVTLHVRRSVGAGRLPSQKDIVLVDVGHLDSQRRGGASKHFHWRICSKLKKKKREKRAKVMSNDNTKCLKFLDGMDQGVRRVRFDDPQCAWWLQVATDSQWTIDASGCHNERLTIAGWGNELNGAKLSFKNNVSNLKDRMKNSFSFCSM